jgi:hypothetical protein
MFVNAHNIELRYRGWIRMQRKIKIKIKIKRKIKIKIKARQRKQTNPNKRGSGYLAMRSRNKKEELQLAWQAKYVLYVVMHNVCLFFFKSIAPVLASTDNDILNSDISSLAATSSLSSNNINNNTTNTTNTTNITNIIPLPANTANQYDISTSNSIMLSLATTIGTINEVTALCTARYSSSNITTLFCSMLQTASTTLYTAFNYASMYLSPSTTMQHTSSLTSLPTTPEATAAIITLPPTPTQTMIHNIEPLSQLTSSLPITPIAQYSVLSLSVFPATPYRATPATGKSNMWL